MAHDQTQVQQLARTSSDGLIAESRGHFDQAEYDRQLQHGIGSTGDAD
jgi:hypothetical protein